MNAEKSRSEDTEPDFESALKQLELLVEQLESGDLGLADSLKHFERGVSLSKQCHAMIDKARQSVELLTNPDDETNTAEFDVSNENRDIPF
ncbi:MAG: exodeoxyribonuclease VII small subunit [Wenzhouxiangella sp.]